MKASRRTFIKSSGALVVSFSLVGSLTRTGFAQAQPAPQTIPVDLDSWIKIQGDGTIKVFTGRTELGQGNRTALSQIVAEELDVPFGRIDMLMGDTGLVPDHGPTVGSGTIRDAGAILRQAAAEARQKLVSLAAAKLSLPIDQLAVRDGVVGALGGAGATVSYAELVGNQQLGIQLNRVMTPFGPGPFANATAKPKDPSQYRLVGTSTPRPDIAAKVSGNFTYITDVRLPGMLHARVVRPTGIKSQLVRIDGFDPAVPGAQIVHEKDFVAVVADTEWDAIRAAESLKVVWTEWNGLPDMSLTSDVLRSAPGMDRQPINKGDAAGAIASATTSLEATYETSMELHGSIGASCAIADVQADKATIWSSYQSPFWLVRDVSPILKLDPKNVRIINVEGSGCYGGNGAHGAAVDAAIISQKLGKPVRVQWSRADENRGEVPSPPTVQDMQGGLDADGNLVGWSHEVWTPPHYGNYYTGALLAGRPEGPLPPGAFNTPNLVYDFTNAAVRQHDQNKFLDSIGTGWLRGPAQMQHTFAMESFVDELAAAGGRDPVEFRMQYLADDRLKEALRRVAEAAGWETRPSPAPGALTASPAIGRGVAVANRDGTFVAEVAEVEVNRSTGDIRVTKFWVAEDHGLTINPKAVEAQIESNVIQATSRTLKEIATWDSSNITSVDWRTYPILTFLEVPEIESIIIDRPDKPSTGVGEPATCPVSAAISNAVFDATGVRLRSTPFRPDKVLAALTLG
jgi:nicotinate dehydrogenase subunit B